MGLGDELIPVEEYVQCHDDVETETASLDRSPELTTD